MTIEEINSRIAVANSKSEKLNDERKINIGKKETLTKQLNEAIQSYTEKYGVVLTPETLYSEIERVTKIKEEELKSVEQVLSLIEEGRYAEAESLINPAQNVSANQSVSGVEEPKVVEPSGVVPPIQTEPVSSITPPPVSTTPVAPPVTPPVDVQPVTPPPVSTPPIAPPPVSTIPVAPPPVTSSPSTPHLSGLDIEVQENTESVTPPPTSPNLVSSFSAILGGTEFGK